MSKPKWSVPGFHLSRNSRIGIYALLLVLLLLIAINALLPLWIGPKDTDNKALAQAWTEFLARNKDSQSIVAADNPFPPARLFVFDPNTASKEDLIHLGIPMKTIYTWLHYREKGGRFYQKEDLQKLYTLSQSDYRRIAPYVSLPGKGPKRQNILSTNTQSFYSPKATAPTLPLNLADTTALKKLPGIGAVFARRIVRYRARLGGFYSIEQLKEVYGLPDSTFQKIAGHFTVNPDKIKRINLNRAFFKDLVHHPYLKPYAKQILQLRRKLGRFSTVEQLRQIDLINEQNYRKIAAYLSI